MIRLLTILLSLCLGYSVQAKVFQEIYVDRKGVMREKDTRKEVSFYGVNYTLPFAHAYRAVGYLGTDRKRAIDRDVYHLARLGFNAFRIHIWDVEITDEKGNLIANEHLDLLDYLIFRLQERGISTLLTAQTNFGNGYPERNIQTGGFSYAYDKCNMHNDPDAVAAQENYLPQLVRHINPYTGHAYFEEPCVVGFEINNEPCHSGTPEQTKAYINRMLSAIGSVGNQKPVFYNVSHNLEHTGAYFDTPIDGGTYQWYPIGLVGGHTRKGNFLPYIDRYTIPFSETPGFESKAKLIYEFDPADITYAHIYPAMARTFRSAGFQWITQFAYDPIDMAAFNTEYQTHFLNLAYTPQKALSMKIAAEVARKVKRLEQFPTYPADTLFGDFRVSYLLDMSVFNDGKSFFYSNSTTEIPRSPKKLEAIAGCGNSPVVSFNGTGAYFLDRLESGIWRLELMPDAVQVADPFSKPSLKKEKVTIAFAEHPITISLADLGADFHVRGMNEGNDVRRQATEGEVRLAPGTYLLSRSGVVSDRWRAETRFQNIRLGEFVAPESPRTQRYFVHHPQKGVNAGDSLSVEATVVYDVPVDSILIYTDAVSFWSDYNPYVVMKQEKPYTYRAKLATGTGSAEQAYRLVVYSGGKCFTYPGGEEGMPLDWDFDSSLFYRSALYAAETPMVLLRPERTFSDGAFSDRTLAAIDPEAWVTCEYTVGTPFKSDYERYRLVTNGKETSFYIRKYLGELLSGRSSEMKKKRLLAISVGQESPEKLEVGFVSKLGLTYTAQLTLPAVREGVYRIPFSDLRQTGTALIPRAYPLFTDAYFVAGEEIPFHIEEIESVEIRIPELKGDAELHLNGVWLE